MLVHLFSICHRKQNIKGERRDIQSYLLYEEEIQNSERKVGKRKDGYCHRFYEGSSNLINVELSRILTVSATATAAIALDLNINIYTCVSFWPNIIYHII